MAEYSPPPPRSRPAGTLTVALVVPLQGPAGIFGPSCELCAQLAVEEVNREHGVLGREVRLVPVDGGAPPEQVADEVGALVAAGTVQAVTGWHISAVREVVAPRIAGRVPYVYTPLYEGGERAPWVFLTGETPGRQLRPALAWFASELGVRRWAIVGDDYVWPRRSARAIRSYIDDLGGELCAEFFVGLGTQDFGGVLRRLARSGCDGVLMLLVGDDAVAFNRAFARAGLDEDRIRFSPLMDENMLLATGADSTRGLFAAAGYFESLPTADSLDFGTRYHSRFGADAPVLNSLGESCYEGVRLFTELARRAQSLDVRRMRELSDGLGYDGPRGPVEMRDRHLRQRVFLAAADGLEFDVIHRL
ncbi:substrate-binding domain-containing protein [Actinomadura rubrisoli]|uniref:substrate-binding domain-containing protein n=1 Tax=Actinomadura rubrisoli TaxID=2530368 RepID=UPI001FB5FF04|nr:substrate-binding domain-containing protein [Actinomadura rubrisoli]